MIKLLFILLLSIVCRSYEPLPEESVDSSEDEPRGCQYGMIRMFFGTRDDFPDDYQRCDGTNTTPDLRDRFPMAAGGAFDIDDYGGSDSISLSKDQLPSHNHRFTGESTSDGGRHRHKARGDIGINGIHNHNPGTLKTVVAGDHKHRFNADTEEEEEGYHTHGYSLTVTRVKAHHHQIEINTFDDGMHTHDDDITVRGDGSHSHDVDITLEDVDAHNHPVEIDEVRITVGDHVHGVGGYALDDHEFDHEHEVNGDADEEGQHYHEVQDDTSKTGKHQHGFDFEADEVDDHKHDYGTLTTTDDGEHLHNIKERNAELQGDHDHTITAYFASDYDSKTTIFAARIDKVDGNYPFDSRASVDGSHAHIVPATNTIVDGTHHHLIKDYVGQNGVHMHDVGGKIIVNGQHIHTIDTKTTARGEHSHDVSGDTDTVDVELEHTLSGISAASGGWGRRIDSGGETDDKGEHNHGATIELKDNGQHLHKFTGAVSDDGDHDHLIDGETESSGAHYHKIKGNIGGDNDGDHDHTVEGDTELNGEHTHGINGYVDDNGRHPHDVEIFMGDMGEHRHEIDGNTNYVGSSDMIRIAPPYYSVWFLCCISDYHEKPTRKPTSRPTRKPTPKRTRRPTRKPTARPVQESASSSLSYSESTGSVPPKRSRRPANDDYNNNGKPTERPSRRPYVQV